jgi:class 3 adenylate cyclase
MQPATRYARSGEFNIAYQVCGEGPFDLVIVPGFISHVDLQWADPDWARGLERLASFSRLITFDKRGTGLSDPTTTLPSLEERMDDLRAVMDAAGSERAVLFGYSEGGPVSALFAATYPDRVAALVLFGAWAMMDERQRKSYDQLADAVDHWGEGRLLGVMAPSAAQNGLGRHLTGSFERAAASPSMARGLLNATTYNVAPVVGNIRVPTLVVHRTGEFLPVGGSRDLAARIPGARFLELDGVDHWWWIGDTDRLLREIEEFLTGTPHAHAPERALATVLFSDVVGSTERAGELGDRAWRELLERLDGLVRRNVDRMRGRVVKTMGDGFLATFDGPTRAIECAQALAREAEVLGLRLRSGVHTGECELIGDDIGGMAVHIAARVSTTAEPGEVLVSRTVKDLVVGSSLRLSDRGVHSLKGVPGEWGLFAVLSGEPVVVDATGDDPPTLTQRVTVRTALRFPRLARPVVRFSRRVASQ